MEYHRKRLKDLTIKNNFMFAAVMLEPENAKGLLELALGVKVDHVDISYEKSIVYNPEYKGVRLDVFLKDTAGTHFNVEMQADAQPVSKRARYYHSHMDMEMLLSGQDYEKLPDSYVLFICDYDPLKLKKYRYTISQYVAEDEKISYSDGRHTVFLSTVGTNENEVPEALVKFLRYVAAGPEASEEDYGDSFVRQLQNSVKKVKTSRDMEERYMLFEEMMKKEFNNGMQEGIQKGVQIGQNNLALQVINTRFTISDSLTERIKSVNDENILSQLIINASAAADQEKFEALADKLLAHQVESTKIN
ncbi:MAG: Rpn family recombination-promoting nuclease/putative transposase [Lachnospiraceae bacterium]|nr:Rpn family recombination-promoting nuclease/putative transposase [Lachnospiraceae bacterium]